MRGDDFLLDDREEDLDLVQPGRVDRGVDHDRVRVGLAEPVDSGLAAMVRAVVHDDEHAGRAPWGTYSCSTRTIRPGAAGSVAWIRSRAWMDGLASNDRIRSPGPSGSPWGKPW